jgi:hypothetical protein
MKFTGIAPFLCGVLLVTNVSVLAAGRTGGQGGNWSVRTVDEGAIRYRIPGFDKDTPDATGAAASAELTKQISDLTSQGWEPFAATVYHDALYSNEKVYFFRKKG